MLGTGGAPLFLSQRALDKVRARKSKVTSYNLDLNLVGDYWGWFGTRSYHHTGMVSLWCAPLGCHPAAVTHLRTGASCPPPQPSMVALSAGGPGSPFRPVKGCKCSGQRMAGGHPCKL